MTLRNSSVFAVLFIGSAFGHIAIAQSPLTQVGEPYQWKVLPPGERMIVGRNRDTQLMVDSATRTMNAPVTVANQVNQEVHDYGPAGVVSGTVRGSLKAATQVLEGAAGTMVGILDVLTAPMGGWD